MKRYREECELATRAAVESAIINATKVAAECAVYADAAYPVVDGVLEATYEVGFAVTGRATDAATINATINATRSAVAAAGLLSSRSR